MSPIDETLTDWQTGKYTQFAIEEWEKEAIVYHLQSGETHLLNRLAVDVLQIIHQRPISFITILNQINSLYQVNNPNELSDQIKALISQFDSVGLIEPAF